MTKDSVSTLGSDDSSRIRLQKVLAAAGLGSRRHCEELIVAGRVSVDGAVVRELGSRVDPERQAVRVDGDRIGTASQTVYLAVHKPRGMVSTMSDDRGRPALGDLVAGRAERLFHVGRLDADSEGLILLTNDGELAHRLMHPSFGVTKTYLAEVTGAVARQTLARARSGVELADGPVRVDRCRVVDAAPGRTLVELVLHEGRKHVVRRLLAELGHPVRRLVRTAVGPVTLGELRPSRSRPLTRTELSALFAVVDKASQ